MRAAEMIADQAAARFEVKILLQQKLLGLLYLPVSHSQELGLK